MIMSKLVLLAHRKMPIQEMAQKHTIQIGALNHGLKEVKILTSNIKGPEAQHLKKVENLK